MTKSSIFSGDAERDTRSLQILLDTIAAVTANIDLDTVLKDIVSRSLQVTSAERALLLLGEDPDELVVRVAQDKDGETLTGDLQWSRSLVRRCLEENVAVRSVVQSDQEALELGRERFAVHGRVGLDRAPEGDAGSGREGLQIDTNELRLRRQRFAPRMGELDVRGDLVERVAPPLEVLRGVEHVLE